MTVHLKKVCQGLMAHLLIKNALYILIPSKLLNVSSDPQKQRIKLGCVTNLWHTTFYHKHQDVAKTDELCRTLLLLLKHEHYFFCI
jgi:hypothetical protein